MKGLYELAIFLAVIVIWAVADYVARHKQNITFTVGLASVVIGCALERLSLAFIVFGVTVCGLMILGRLLTMHRAVRKESGDA